MPPPKPRERYNAKARQSSVGSTHKKRKQVAQTGAGDDEGAGLSAGASTSNAVLIDPVEEQQRREADKQRRALLAQHDVDASEAPISSRKRKRLDAFIARQLKKEKRQQLIADLAKSSARMGDRSALVTAATLGTGRAQTGQDRLDQEAAKEDRVGKRRRNGYAVIDAEASESEASDTDNDGQANGRHSLVADSMTEKADDDDDDVREARIARARALFAGNQAGQVKASQAEAKSVAASKGDEETPTKQTQALGSALALGPDGKPVLPIVKKKKPQARRPRGQKTAWGRTRANGDASEASSDEESDFDSSASSGDESDSADEVATEDEDEQEAVLATHGKGQMNDHGAVKLSDKPEKYSVADDADGTDGSNGGSSRDDEDSDSQDPGTETDEEEQAILEEAMRLRGMLGNPDIAPPTEADFALSDEGEDAKEEEASDNGNLPFTAFDDAESATHADGDRAPDSLENDEDDESSDVAQDDDDVNGETEEEDAEHSGADFLKGLEQPSRRHGLPKTERSQGFKDWAKSALGLSQAEGSTNSWNEDEYKGPEPVAGLSHKVGDGWDGGIRGPLGQAEPSVQSLDAFAQRHYEELKTSDQLAPKTFHVTRSEELQEARLRLPVVADEERIVRTISENMVTILCGETGSGKTTQVPQFMFEAGFGSPGSANPGMIGVTQPRRVAALSMAARVGQELGLGPHRVSHQIRYDANVSPSTSIKFMTDGVLLRELAQDFLLEKYSAIIIDEAHERSVNTDVLIGVLSRVIQLRAKRWLAGHGRPLRLIIMSATLRVDDFAQNERLFQTAVPILQIEARQYPVVTHFSRRTHHDYVEETIKKACKIHARLPHGGILIFLTGQAEIATVCKRLDARYGRRAIQRRVAARERVQARKSHTSHDDGTQDSATLDEITVAAKDGDIETEELDLGVGQLDQEGSLAADVDDVDGFNDEEALETDDEHVPEYDADLPAELRDDTDKPMHILPLYSLLPSDKQMEVFQPPPQGSRLVVVATNIAETSLTIPGISYVVDCGRSKERKYDAVNGVQSFEVGFISKASANQRAGRAGRTGPGHCYRLYSSNLYEEHMPIFAEPEILRTPVDNLVLMMKSMNIDNVANFPFPTPPDRETLLRAEKLLLRLGALEQSGSSSARGRPIVSASENKITPLGRAMSLFPLSTRLSKLLVQGHQHGCLALVVALVAALSVGDPFIREESLHDRLDGTDNEALEEAGTAEGEARRAKRSAYFKSLNRFAAMSGALSDPLRLLSAVGAYEHEGGSLTFCEKHFLVPKTMEEIHKLRSQISSLVRANAAPGVDATVLRSPRLAPPTPQQLIVLRQFLLAAYIDQVAIRADLAPESAAQVPSLQSGSQDGGVDGTVSRQFHHQQKLGAQMQSTRNVAYLAAGIPHEACFIHKSSVLFHQSPPEWIVFFEVMRGRAKGDRLERQGRNWLKGVTVVSPKWIYKLGPTLCSLSKPVEAETSDARSRLVQAAQELKKRQQHQQSASNANGSTSQLSTPTLEKTVYLVPSYGTGSAVEVSERSSHVGWSLPPILAKQRFMSGRWITEMP